VAVEQRRVEEEQIQRDGDDDLWDADEHQQCARGDRPARELEAVDPVGGGGGEGGTEHARRRRHEHAVPEIREREREQ
jgi:hypothetical protein